MGAETVFFDFKVATLFAPTAWANEVYFVKPVNGGGFSNSATENNYYNYGSPRLLKIGTTSAGGYYAASDMGVFSFCAPILPGDGNVYFQGYRSPLAFNQLERVSTFGGSALGSAGFFYDANANELKIAAPPAVANGVIYFKSNDGTLWAVSSNGAGVGTQITNYAIATTPYPASDGALYFQDTSNEVYQYNLTTGLTRDLLIQSLSPLTGYDNGDGTITLFFRGYYNGQSVLMKFTPPTL